jgi:hypothetical protein
MDSINCFRNLTVRGILSSAGRILLPTLNTSSSGIPQMIKKIDLSFFEEKINAAPFVTCPK